jgi:hypothetical protein
MVNLGTLNIEFKLSKDIADYIDEAIAKALNERRSKIPDALNNPSVVIDDRREGEWYWVSKDNRNWFIAQYDKDAVGGWKNSDTWEDWDKEIIAWIHIPHPNDE